MGTKMKTRQGHSWYKGDLHLYTQEFLIEIINDLLDEDLGKRIKEVIKDKGLHQELKPLSSKHQKTGEINNEIRREF